MWAGCIQFACGRVRVWGFISAAPARIFSLPMHLHCHCLHCRAVAWSTPPCLQVALPKDHTQGILMKTMGPDRSKNLRSLHPAPSKYLSGEIYPLCLSSVPSPTAGAAGWSMPISAEVPCLVFSVLSELAHNTEAMPPRKQIKEICLQGSMEGRWKTHRPSTGAAVPSLDRQTGSF